MARKKITDLLGSELANLQSLTEPKSETSSASPSELSPEEQDEQDTELQSPTDTDLQTSKVTGSKKAREIEAELTTLENSTTKLQSPKESDSETLQAPKYLRLERKEVRLRLDQLDLLTSLVRRLNRVRKGKGERLTENTLIRVAIDLLLENTNQLQGITEDELLESLGLPPSDSR